MQSKSGRRNGRDVGSVGAGRGSARPVARIAGGLQGLRRILLGGAALSTLGLGLAAPAYAVDGVTVVEHYITASDSFIINAPNPIVATGDGALGILVDGDVGSVDVTVQRTGDVQSGKDKAIYLHTSGDISLTSSGVMDGYLHAISLASYEDGTIFLDQTGNVNSRKDTAVYATGPGSVDLTIDGNVDGYAEGVHANSFGNATVGVDVTGTVLARTNRGIYAYSGGAVDVTVDGKIDAYGDAVYANTFGSSGITVDLGDDVLSRTGNGVYAYGGGSITIDVDGKVDAYADAVYANTYGNSAIDIDVHDDITARIGRGVYAYSGGSIDVDVFGNIDSNSDGLYGNSFGSGGVSLSATGNITAHTGRGVYAYSAGDIDINVGGAIRSTQAAVYADGYGGGTDVDVTIGGNAVSDETYAVYVNTSGQIDIDTKSVTGKTDAINANTYAGGIEIDVAGDVTGWTGQGIYAHALNTIDIDVTGDVSGKTNGVYASTYGTSGNIIVNVDGSVLGETGYGIYTSAASAGISVTNGGGVTAYNDAIYAQSSGSTSGNVSVNSTGAIKSGRGYGIYAQSDYHGATVVNDGAIDAYYDGIYAQAIGNNSDAFVSVTSAGQIKSGTGRGISADSNYQRATVYNRGDIIARTDGIHAASLSDSATGYVDIDTVGDITADSGIGIDTRSNSGRIFIHNTGDIIAKKEGIKAVDYGDDLSAAIAIWQTGDVTSYDEYGVYAIGAHEAVGLAMTGDLVSKKTGIYAHSLGAEASAIVNVTMHGDLQSYDGYGIDALSTFSNVWVDYAGTMISKLDGIHAVTNANTADARLSISQAGSLTSYSGYGIYGTATEGGVTVLASNTNIQGKLGGIYAKASGDVDDATVDIYTAGNIHTWDGAGIYAESTSETVKVDAGGGTI